MQRNIIRKLVDSHRHITYRHGEPLTRRDLIGAGYIATGGMVLLPHVSKLFGDRAYAAEECTVTGSTGGANQSAVILVDLGGGATLPFNFPPMGVNGLPLPSGSYRSVGIAATDDPNNVPLDTTFGVPMNPNSRILQGMKNTLGIDPANGAINQQAEEFAARVNGYITCVSNGDDTQNNEHNLLMGLAKIGYQRLIHATGDSDNANGSGGRSAPVADWFDATKIPVTIRNAQDAVNIVLPPVLKDYLPDRSYKAVTSIIQNWSLADQAYFLSKSEPEQVDIVKRLADKKCAYEESGTLVSRYTPAQVDIAQDENADFRNLWTNDQGNGSIIKLLADDIAVGGVVTRGGYDYHGNGAQQQNQRDLQAGELLGRIIRSFCLKGKNAMISLFTHGGTNSNGEAATANEQRIDASGDSGNRGLRVTFFVNGAGTGTAPTPAVTDKLADADGYRTYQAQLQAIFQPKMKTETKQFGAYNNTGAVDSQADSLVSTSPANCCKVDILNLLAFDGNLDLKSRLDLPDAEKYAIMMETKPA